MDYFQGFPIILGIFYSEFHPTQGPKVVFQVPEGLIVSSSNTSSVSTHPNSITPNHLASPPTRIVSGNASSTNQLRSVFGSPAPPPLSTLASSSSTNNNSITTNNNNTTTNNNNTNKDSTTNAATTTSTNSTFNNVSNVASIRYNNNNYIPPTTTTSVMVSTAAVSSWINQESFLANSMTVTSPLTVSLNASQMQRMKNNDFPSARGASYSITGNSPMIQEAHFVDFDSISEYIIPKTELSNRLVVISTNSHKVVGYPVSIQHDRYERNALLFNLCFVFEKQANVGSFIPIMNKIARLLKGLELESEFLSKQETKPQLLDIMEQILEDLNNYSECQISVTPSDTFSLKLFPEYISPPVIEDHQVPVCILNLERFMDKYWDMTMRRVIPLINGVNSVKRISIFSDVQHTLVKSCIRHLLYYGCVKMVDIFQFSNVYAVQPHVNSLLHSVAAKKPLVEFVTLEGHPPLTFSLLFQFYTGLKRGQSVKEWIQEYKIDEYPLDIRRFVIYGVIQGFISRIHKYPVLINTNVNNLAFQKTNFHQSLKQDDYLEMTISNLRRYLDGKHCYDEICTVFGCSSNELDELFSHPDWNIKFTYL